jgi:NAD(P)-dependent dehydrogenase (short-subunit alcohol dehydrogenase family)
MKRDAFQLDPSAAGEKGQRLVDHFTPGSDQLGRMGTIADIVQGVLYLETATFVTGEFLRIDGGQSAGH